MWLATGNDYNHNKLCQWIILELGPVLIESYVNNVIYDSDSVQTSKCVVQKVERLNVGI